jgi:hypothetical protein
MIYRLRVRGSTVRNLRFSFRGNHGAKNATGAKTAGEEIAAERFVGVRNPLLSAMKAFTIARPTPDPAMPITAASSDGYGAQSRVHSTSKGANEMPHRP